MSLDKDQDRIEFERLIDELSDIAYDEMDDYETKFVEDSADRIDKFKEKLHITEGQMNFARKLYEKYL